MGEKRLEKALETIESLNEAVLAARMYPVTAPHATATFKRALQNISSYIAVYHQLHCGIIEKRPFIQGEPVPADREKEVGQFAVFLQLELLGLPHLQLGLDFSEELLRKLFLIFSSRKEQIVRKGGGRAFVEMMGVSQYFPDDIESPQQKDVKHTKKGEGRYINLEGLVYPPEYPVHTFLEETAALEKNDQGFHLLSDEEKLSLLLHIIQSILSASFLDDTVPELYPALTEAVSRFDKFIPDEKKSLLAEQFVSMLYPRVLEIKVFGAILLQPMQSPFGMQLQDQLVGRLSKQERFSLADLMSQYADRLDRKTAEGKELGEKNDQLSRTLREDVRQDNAGEKTDSQNDAVDEKFQQQISELLDCREVMALVPREVKKYLDEGDSNRIRSLLRISQKKIDSNKGGDKAKQYNGAFCLIVELLIRNGREELLFAHVDFFIHWLQAADQADFLFEKYAEALQAIANYALQEGDFSTGRKIVTVFADIRKDKEKRPAPVKALAARIQDRMVKSDLLDGLVADYLENPRQQSQIGPLIIDLGMNGIIHLLNTLITTEKTGVRLTLIKLLETAGPVLPSAILKILNQKLPWYAKRNLLQLLGKTGNSLHGQRVVDIGRDKDLRVQNEALKCLRLIGGSKLKDLLLQCLEFVADELKIQVLEVIWPISDEAVADSLLDFFQQAGGMKAVASKSWFELACLALGHSKSASAYSWLKEFIEQGKKDKAIPRAAVDIAEQAFMSLGLSLDDKNRGPSAARAGADEQERVARTEKKAVAVDGTAQPRPLGITFLPKEKRARELLKAGKEDEAIALIMELIIETAGQRKFDQADSLREWLIKVAPMSLIQAIKAAEIIQEQKSRAIDRGHLEVWSDLYDVLSTEEFTTLYHSMQHRHYRANEVIIEQHTRMPALFFVNRGRVKLYYSDKGSSEVLVRIVGPGDIVGVDTFFNASLWTITASTMGSCDVSMLRLDAQKKWNDEFPALESKLHDFCLHYESLQEFFKNTRKDRRQYERKKIEARVATTILDARKEPTNVSAKGELFDISCGGLSFFMRISAKNQVHVLLGQQIRIFLPSPDVAPDKVVPVDGMVVAVRGHLVMENEYSVHVSFEDNLKPVQLQRFINAARDSSAKG